MSVHSTGVLILGAGINGAALARELLLNGVSVWLVDAADVASGATSGSSRLIHGGLRYLEYGELDLVRESLAERGRLLRLAPQFVRPLKLWIPVSSRFGGMLSAPGRFFDWKWWPQPTPADGRGVTLIRAGLALYDAYARDSLLPRHQVLRSSHTDAMPVDSQKYRWLCSYYDGQVVYPERLVVSMLADARRIADAQGLDFQLWNYHQASLRGDTVEILSAGGSPTQSATSVRPAVIVNATGAWVDETLKRLHVPSDRLMGGTKGSHLFSFNPRLREALAGQGMYGEASDGRPIFVLPLADTILIGTTDLPFTGQPEDATASGREIDYLLSAVNTFLPGVNLTKDDVNFHYSAVRPLPYVSATTPAAISRRHAMVENSQSSLPLFSLVGGKLTTMRSLAETAAATVLARMGRAVIANSRERVFPGGEGFPTDDAAIDRAIGDIARQTNTSPDSVAAVWRLAGTLCETILASSDEKAPVRDSNLPRAMVRWSVRHESARTLSDLVERRLMLLYDQRLTSACLRHLAEILAEEGQLVPDQVDNAVAAEVERLRRHYGKLVT